MPLQRSFWKIPKSAMTVTDTDGNTVPAFGDVVLYDESPQFAYVLAAQWDRPDIAAVGTREDLSKSASRGRFLRTTVRRKGAKAGDPKEVHRVKASAVLTADDVLDADVPAILFAGDEPHDVIGGAALAEAAQRIAKEKVGAAAAEEAVIRTAAQAEVDAIAPDPPEAPAPEGP